MKKFIAMHGASAFEFMAVNRIDAMRVLMERGCHNHVIVWEQPEGKPVEDLIEIKDTPKKK